MQVTLRLSGMTAIQGQMLARIQQTITLAAILLAGLAVFTGWRTGHAGWGFLAAFVIFSGHAVVLGFEFLLLRAVHGKDLAPRASAQQLLRAWWGEVLAAPVVFCWRQPFFSQTWPDHLPPVQARPARRGVLLIHGFFCNRGIWNPWLKRLIAQGTPTVAVNLEPVFGSIDDYVDAIEQAVNRLERHTGLPPLVVAHSMGGLALRHWWAGQTAARIHHLVTLGTPHQGTWLARFAMSRNSQQMRQLSSWLQVLAKREPAQHAARTTCFYSHCDNIVFPASAATLPGANNCHLSGVAHVDMVNRQEPWREVQSRLAEPH